MRNEGLGSWPARRARKTPHRTALIHGGTSTDYRTLHTRTTRLAHALRDRGIRRGDRIAYLGPNHPSYLETLFAAGQVIIFAIGVPWLAVSLGVSLGEAISLGFTPFIVGGIVKAVGATALLSSAWRLAGGRG